MAYHLTGAGSFVSYLGVDVILKQSIEPIVMGELILLSGGVVAIIGIGYVYEAVRDLLEESFLLETDPTEYLTNLRQLNLHARTLQQQTQDLTLVDPIHAEHLEKKYGLETLKDKMRTAQQELQKTADITSKLLALTNTPQLPLPQNYTHKIAKELEELETSPIASAVQRLTSKQNQASLSSALRANDAQSEQQ